MEDGINDDTAGKPMATGLVPRLVSEASVYRGPNVNLSSDTRLTLFVLKHLKDVSKEPALCLLPHAGTDKGQVAVGTSWASQAVLSMTRK